MDKVDRAILETLRGGPRGRGLAGDIGEGETNLARSIIGGATDIVSTITQGVVQSRQAEAKAEAGVSAAQQRTDELERMLEESGGRAEGAAEDMTGAGMIRVSTPWTKIALGSAAGLAVIGGVIYFVTRDED